MATAAITAGSVPSTSSSASSSASSINANVQNRSFSLSTQPTFTDSPKQHQHFQNLSQQSHGQRGPTSAPITASSPLTGSAPAPGPSSADFYQRPPAPGSSTTLGTSRAAQKPSPSGSAIGGASKFVAHGSTAFTSSTGINGHVNPPSQQQPSSAPASHQQQTPFNLHHLQEQQQQQHAAGLSNTHSKQNPGHQGFITTAESPLSYTSAHRAPHPPAAFPTTTLLNAQASTTFSADGTGTASSNAVFPMTSQQQHQHPSLSHLQPANPQTLHTGSTSLHTATTANASGTSFGEKVELFSSVSLSDHRHLFHAYIYDYLFRQGYERTARAFLQDAPNVPTKQNRKGKHNLNSSDNGNSTAGPSSVNVSTSSSSRNKRKRTEDGEESSEQRQIPENEDLQTTARGRKRTSTVTNVDLSTSFEDDEETYDENDISHPRRTTAALGSQDASNKPNTSSSEESSATSSSLQFFSKDSSSISSNGTAGTSVTGASSVSMINHNQSQGGTKGSEESSDDTATVNMNSTNSPVGSRGTFSPTLFSPASTFQQSPEKPAYVSLIEDEGGKRDEGNEDADMLSGDNADQQEIQGMDSLPMPDIQIESNWGFLYEWWEVFWDVWRAKGAKGAGSLAAKAYERTLHDFPQPTLNGVPLPTIQPGVGGLPVYAGQQNHTMIQQLEQPHIHGHSLDPPKRQSMVAPPSHPQQQQQFARHFDQQAPLTLVGAPKLTPAQPQPPSRQASIVLPSSVASISSQLPEEGRFTAQPPQPQTVSVQQAAVQQQNRQRNASLPLALAVQSHAGGSGLGTASAIQQQQQEEGKKGPGSPPLHKQPPLGVHAAQQAQQAQQQQQQGHRPDQQPQRSAASVPPSPALPSAPQLQHEAVQAPPKPMPPHGASLHPRPVQQRIQQQLQHPPALLHQQNNAYIPEQEPQPPTGPIHPHMQQQQQQEAAQMQMHMQQQHMQMQQQHAQQQPTPQQAHMQLQPGHQVAILPQGVQTAHKGQPVPAYAVGRRRHALSSATAMPGPPGQLQQGAPPMHIQMPGQQMHMRPVQAQHFARPEESSPGIQGGRVPPGQSAGVPVGPPSQVIAVPMQPSTHPHMAQMQNRGQFLQGHQPPVGYTVASQAQVGQQQVQGQSQRVLVPGQHQTVEIPRPGPGKQGQQPLQQVHQGPSYAPGPPGQQPYHQPGVSMDHSRRTPSVADYASSSAGGATRAPSRHAGRSPAYMHASVGAQPSGQPQPIDLRQPQPYENMQMTDTHFMSSPLPGKEGQHSAQMQWRRLPNGQLVPAQQATPPQQQIQHQLQPQHTGGPQAQAAPQHDVQQYRANMRNNLQARQMQLANGLGPRDAFSPHADTPPQHRMQPPPQQNGPSTSPFSIQGQGQHQTQGQAPQSTQQTGQQSQQAMQQQAQVAMQQHHAQQAMHQQEQHAHQQQQLAQQQYAQHHAQQMDAQHHAQQQQQREQQQYLNAQDQQQAQQTVFKSPNVAHLQQQQQSGFSPQAHDYAFEASSQPPHQQLQQQQQQSASEDTTSSTATHQSQPRHAQEANGASTHQQDAQGRQNEQSMRQNSANQTAIGAMPPPAPPAGRRGAVAPQPAGSQQLVRAPTPASQAATPNGMLQGSPEAQLSQPLTPHTPRTPNAQAMSAGAVSVPGSGGSATAPTVVPAPKGRKRTNTDTSGKEKKPRMTKAKKDAAAAAASQGERGQTVSATVTPQTQSVPLPADDNNFQIAVPQNYGQTNGTDYHHQQPSSMALAVQGATPNQQQSQAPTPQQQHHHQQSGMQSAGIEVPQNYAVPSLDFNFDTSMDLSQFGIPNLQAGEFNASLLDDANLNFDDFLVSGWSGGS